MFCLSIERTVADKFLHGRTTGWSRGEKPVGGLERGDRQAGCASCSYRTTSSCISQTSVRSWYVLLLLSLHLVVGSFVRLLNVLLETA